MLYFMAFLCCAGSLKFPPVQKTSSPVLEFFFESEPFSSLGSGGSLRSTGEPVLVQENAILDNQNAEDINLLHTVPRI